MFIISKFAEFNNLIPLINISHSAYRIKVERRLTKSTVILSSLFIFCKSIDFVQLMLTGVSESLRLELGFEEKSVLNLVKQLAYLFNMSFHVVNSFVYVGMDSQLKIIVFRYEIKFSCFHV